MNKLRTILALIAVAVLLLSGCGRASGDNGVPADSVISANAVATSSQTGTDSVPGDSTVAAAVESSVLAAVEERNVPAIYLIIPTETGLSAQMEDIILKGARRAGYDVIVKTHDGVTEKQSAAFREAVSGKACAVICDNIAGDEIKADTQTAKDAGIPVFLVNRGVPDEGICDGQVRTDRNSAMISLAEIFARHHRLRETYALIYNANNSF
jgi:erythritol transport system substrate-binding protein